MTQYISHKPRRANDKNWAMSMALILMIGMGTLFATGYFWTRHLDSTQAQRAQQAQFEIYQRSTQPQARRTAPATATPSPSAEMLQTQAIRARLLNHPHVTPKSGFDQPGVQSTGIAIVDAIDGAQTKIR